MYSLFANADTAEQVAHVSGLFPDNFWAGVLGTVIYALIAAAMFSCSTRCWIGSRPAT
jgi:hypothetical protein